MYSTGGARIESILRRIVTQDQQKVYILSCALNLHQKAASRDK